MTAAADREIQRLMRLPWTVTAEISPEGERLLRVREIPSAVGCGSTDEEAVADLWASLEASLRAYVHFGDVVPLPAGAAPSFASARALEPKKTWILVASESASRTAATSGLGA